jgi:protein-S-isoprenylcysteine O-methyltransferase Ste14
MAGGARDRLGAGRRIFVPVLVYLILVAAVRLWAPSWLAFSMLPGWAWPVGGGLLVLGLTAYGVAYAQLSRAIRQRRLATEGLFRWCRHPIYAAWVYLTLPGVSLILGTVLAFASLPLAVLLFLIYIRIEERRLAERFGEAYCAYRARTPALIPWPWRRSRRDAGKG